MLRVGWHGTHADVEVTRVRVGFQLNPHALPSRVKNYKSRQILRKAGLSERPTDSPDALPLHVKPSGFAIEALARTPTSAIDAVDGSSTGTRVPRSGRRGSGANGFDPIGYAGG